MSLKAIFLPWLVIGDLQRERRDLLAINQREREDRQGWFRRANELSGEVDRLGARNVDLRAQIAKFDGDGDGRIGGSRSKQPR